MLQFRQAGCLHAVPHLPIPSCSVFITKDSRSMWKAGFYACHSKCCTAEAFANQTIRSEFLTCQILSPYKRTVSGEFILNFPGAEAGNPYEICCSCKNVPKYGNKIPKSSSKSE